MKWKSQDDGKLNFMAEELELNRKYIWDKKSYNKLINFIDVKDNLKVLDVGTGTGYIIRQIAKRSLGSELYGIDISDDLLEYAKIKSKQEECDIHFKNANIYKLPFKDNYFDLVTCQFVLVTLKEPNEALKEIYRVLKKNGKFVAIEVPDNMRINYNPNIPIDMLSLEGKINKQITTSCSKIGVDKNIGIKLPEMLQQNGFSDIDIEGYLNIKLGNYPGDINGIIERGQYLLRILCRQERRMDTLISENLITQEEKDEYIKFYRGRYQKMIDEPETIINDMSVYGSLSMLIKGYKR